MRASFDKLASGQWRASGTPATQEISCPWVGSARLGSVLVSGILAGRASMIWTGSG